MINLIYSAIEKGAKIFPSVSGGKDSQAMVKTMIAWKIPIAGLIHADLGRVEWEESAGMCEKLAKESGAPLHVVTRKDKRDLLSHWEMRMNKLKDTGKPFWSSSMQRYCTSDMKRDPIDLFLRNCGHDLIICGEGLRTAESKQREKTIKKNGTLFVRKRASAKIYKKMTAEQAIENFVPGKRLVLTWYPIAGFSKADVWTTEGMTEGDLSAARLIYQTTKTVPDFWPFHPAYVYGNERVSCKFCILGCLGDLKTGAEHDSAGLLDKMIDLEERGKATFKNGWSLKELKQKILT